jgi:aldehyde dehydrogenase (NAD+)
MSTAVGCPGRFDDGPWSASRRPSGRPSLRLAEVLADRIDDLIELNIAEAGATRDLAASGQTRVPLGFFRQWAERAATFSFVEPLPPFQGERLGQGVILKEPVGVVAAITPFNFPVLLNLHKLGPALAMGNTVVLKPSPYTPLEAFFIAQAVEDAEIPKGVVNVLVGGDDVGRADRAPGGRHGGVHGLTASGASSWGRPPPR